MRAGFAVVYRNRLLHWELDSEHTPRGPTPSKMLPKEPHKWFISSSESLLPQAGKFVFDLELFAGHQNIWFLITGPNWSLMYWHRHTGKTKPAELYNIFTSISQTFPHKHFKCFYLNPSCLGGITCSRVYLGTEECWTRTDKFGHPSVTCNHNSV